jgi:hypothetical protein
MRRVALVVGVGTPEQAAFRRWLERWRPFMRQVLGDEGCRRCVEIHFVEALPDVLAGVPAGVVVLDAWPAVAELEARYCRCPRPNLSEAERRLLENALDAHDNLWDWKSSVADVWAAYSATAEELRGTPHHAEFVPAVAALADVMRSGLPAVEQWSRACGGTDNLRQYLARQLRWAGTGGATDAGPGSVLSTGDS